MWAPDQPNEGTPHREGEWRASITQRPGPPGQLGPSQVYPAVALLPAHLGSLAHLPLGLLQPGPKLPLLPLKGGTASFQLLPLLKQLRKVVLQLPLLLLQLEHLQLQQLLSPPGPLCLGRTVLPRGLVLSPPVPWPLTECLWVRRPRGPVKPPKC